MLDAVAVVIHRCHCFSGDVTIGDTMVAVKPTRHWILGAVFVCTAAPRLLYALIFRPNLITEQWDLASNLLQHGGLGIEGATTTRFEPLYPLFLAGARWLVGGDVFAVQLIQIAVASLAGVCLYGLTDALTSSRRAAMIAAALFAGYPLFIRHAADGKDTALVTVFLLAFCWAFVRARTVAGAALAGVWLGLALLTRTMIVPMVVLAPLVWLFQRRAGAAGALALSACLIFAPYAVRNLGLNGRMMPTRGGLNLLNANSPYSAAILPAYPPDLLSGEGNRILAQAGLDSDTTSPALERRQDEALTRQAWEYMRRHPRETIGLRVRNAASLFSPFLVPRYEWVEDFARDVTLGPDGHVRVEHGVSQPRLIRLVYTASYAPMLALALAGIARRRRAWRRDAVLWCVVATYVAIYSIFAPSTFYRTPMDFVLLFYAAAALDGLAPGFSRASASEKLEGDGDPGREALA